MTRYICPDCGVGGANPKDRPAPFCHVCPDKVTMYEELKEIRQLKHYRKHSHVAVWGYDLYPFYLCGVVQEFRAEGYVNVHGYDSMLFKPLKLLWGNEGRQFLIDAYMLEKEHRQARDEFQREWKIRAEVLLDA